jgi:hypothetical protein
MARKEVEICDESLEVSASSASICLKTGTFRRFDRLNTRRLHLRTFRRFIANRDFRSDQVADRRFDQLYEQGAL